MIHPARILARCDALARHSELPGGLTRVFLSDEQRAANELVLGWMREAGMHARLDEIGNCCGRYEGDQPGLPCLMLGSHLDTVRDAGRYDGMLGVVTAIECVHALHDAARWPRPHMSSRGTGLSLPGRPWATSRRRGPRRAGARGFAASGAAG